MAMTPKGRARLSILVLVVVLPIWIIIAVNLADLVSRENILVELLVFAVLGVVWILPFKKLFLGVAAKNRDDQPPEGE